MPIKKKYLIDIHFDVFSRFFKKVFKYETAPVITRYATEIFTYLFVCIYALKGVFEGVAEKVRWGNFSQVKKVPLF